MAEALPAAVAAVESPTSSPVAGAGAATSAGVEAEDDDYADSAYDGDSVASSTTSIGSSVLKYREENGRTYHAYKVCSKTLLLEGR
jgi:hypothetical protein